MAGNLVQDPNTEKCSYFVLKTVEVATFYLSHMTLFSVLLEMISCFLGSNTVRDIASVRTCPR